MITLSHRISRTAISRRSLLAATGGALLGAAAGVRLPAVGGASQNGESSDEVVADLLSLVPPDLVSFDGPDPLFYFDDFKRQLDAHGAPMPEVVDGVPQLEDDFYQMAPLPLVATAYQYKRDSDWMETFGFSAYAAHRMVMVDEPPNEMTIFSGGLDTGAIAVALDRSGYSQVDLEVGGSFWSFGDGISKDTTSLVSRLGGPGVNNAILLDDGVVFAYEPSAIQKLAMIRAEQAPSMLEYPELESFLATFSDDLVGLVLVSRANIERSDAAGVPLEGGAPDIDSGDSSQTRFLAFGMRAGAGSMPTSPDASPAAGDGLEPGPEPGPAKVEARALMRSRNAAKRAAAEIPQRWNQGVSNVFGMPFGELMTVDRSGVSRDNPLVAEVDFTSEYAGREWGLVQNHDLNPFQLNAKQE